MFRVGTIMMTKNFCILAKIHFSARTTSKIHLNCHKMYSGINIFPTRPEKPGNHGSQIVRFFR